MPWPARSRWRRGGCLLSTYYPAPLIPAKAGIQFPCWVGLGVSFGRADRPRKVADQPRKVLMRHVLHAGGVSGAADYARQPQFDLPGGRGDNATHRQRALADLAPARQFAFGVRPLGLELLDRGERLLAHVHGVDRLCGLDDVVEYHLDFLG